MTRPCLVHDRISFIGLRQILGRVPEIILGRDLDLVEVLETNSNLLYPMAHWVMVLGKMTK